MRGLLALLITTLTFAALSCGSSVTETSDISQLESQPGLAALPKDKAQPWEQLDSRGYVIPAASGKGTSAFAGSATFTPGVERFSEVGIVSDDGETSVVVAGSNSLSAGIYRI